ncbi:MAG: hypothetical protein AAFX87_19905 [Bacteroidota bacterium]
MTSIKITIMLLMMVIGRSAVAFNGTGENKKGNKLEVVRSSDGKVFRVMYKSASAKKVKVKIYNENGRIIMVDFINHGAFLRPYNFEKLSEGQYRLEIENGSELDVAYLNYQLIQEVSEKAVRIKKLGEADKKIVVTIANQGKENVNIKIYDDRSNLVYKAYERLDGNFARIYNLKNIDSNAFTVEVTDSAQQTIEKQILK